MKRVPFNVSVAIKGAGYPQNVKSTVYYSTNGYLCTDGSCNYVCAAPYAMEVGLWLWREKNTAVWAEYYYQDNKWYAYYDGEPLAACINAGDYAEGKDDPEEAIIAAIEYLVDNDLIK